MTMETLLLENLWKLSAEDAKPQEKHAAQLDVVVIKAVCHVHHTVVVSQENTVIIHSKLIMITIYHFSTVAIFNPPPPKILFKIEF